MICDVTFPDLFILHSSAHTLAPLASLQYENGDLITVGSIAKPLIEIFPINRPITSCVNGMVFITLIISCIKAYLHPFVAS